VFAHIIVKLAVQTESWGFSMKPHLCFLSMLAEQEEGTHSQAKSGMGTKDAWILQNTRSLHHPTFKTKLFRISQKHSALSTS
jgi:hypothetical protein